jgi:hypothetical protein
MATVNGVVAGALGVLGAHDAKAWSFFGDRLNVHFKSSASIS